ncbi:MAG: MlaE family lipid ABC transporter permease subunit [Pseudomonadales bacterium]
MAGQQVRVQAPVIAPELDQAASADGVVLRISGDWSFHTLAAVERLVHRIGRLAEPRVVIDCAQLRRLDLAGAWLLQRTAWELERRDVSVRIVGCGDARRRLLDLVVRWPGDLPTDGRRRLAFSWRLLQPVERTGRAAVNVVRDVGLVATRAVHGFLHPSRLALRETLAQIDAAGVRAVPIVALVAFLMGVVLAYQGAVQLAEFGAEILTVDLVAIAMWREMAGLITAIIVAGRSGSAFAATLGSMKLREELDALRVVGVDPVSALVAPRIAALVVALPVLAVMANVVGLLGAWILSATALDITTAQFIDRLRIAVDLNDFLVGLVKLPVFAVIIAGVGTLRGMEVEHSAEELGKQTTRAVVESITAVIVAAALFSVIFAELGI